MSLPKIKKILFFTLSNLGDVFLSLPALDALRALFPDAEITAMIGPRPREVLDGSRLIDKLLIYDKQMPLRGKARLFQQLSAERFDLVIDLRNSLYGALLPARFRTSCLLRIPPQITHMRARNLYRVQKALGLNASLPAGSARAFSYEPADKEQSESLLHNAGVRVDEQILLISHATSGSTRRWEDDNFVCLCSRLAGRFRIIFIGAREHKEQAHRIIERSGAPGILNFSGETTLRQLAYLMSRAACVLSCDTGTAHIASYMNAPLLTLFGPGDDSRYAPWSQHSEMIARQIFCRPCQQAQCRYQTVACMKLISPDEVARRIGLFLAPACADKKPQEYQRILIARTDRIGDVILSTPVFKALRTRYPNAYIAALTGPQARDIVEGNPYIDKVLIYDKKGAQRGMAATLSFARRLKRERFDLAFVLHPTNRMHLVMRLAGIPRRIGYDRKLGFLLTDKIAHQKQQGAKHESEYNFDLLRAAGIEDESAELFMPVDKQAEQWAERIIREAGFLPEDRLLAVQPAASCPSKVWSARRFAQVADILTSRHGFKIVLIAGSEHALCVREVLRNMRGGALDLAGKTTLAQLASILRRCRLLISNDSGPMHLAAAVGTPVVAIFGRKQAGLSPVRWGPLGKRKAVLHKDAGCLECLAHNCRKGYACLEAVSVEEVIKAAQSLLEHPPF